MIPRQVSPTDLIARFQVHPVVQQYSLMKDNGTFRDPTDEDLRNCGLIVTTLATASSLTCLNLSFTHIVIDEAAQALECEVLIPLSLAGRRTRLILAGDQMQLAPEIYSDLAYERGLGVSLLERIYGMYPQTHPCRIHLCQNYRAHEDIIKFTSEMFYDGVVKPGSNLLAKHPVLKPLTFFAVQEEEVQVRFDYLNWMFLNLWLNFVITSISIRYHLLACTLSVTCRVYTQLTRFW